VQCGATRDAGDQRRLLSSRAPFHAPVVIVSRAPTFRRAGEHRQVAPANVGDKPSAAAFARNHWSAFDLVDERRDVVRARKAEGPASVRNETDHRRATKDDLCGEGLLDGVDRPAATPASERSHARHCNGYATEVRLGENILFAASLPHMGASSGLHGPAIPSVVAP
jgi:hypothetical protein